MTLKTLAMPIVEPVSRRRVWISWALAQQVWARRQGRVLPRDYLGLGIVVQAAQLAA